MVLAIRVRCHDAARRIGGKNMGDSGPQRRPFAQIFRMGKNRPFARRKNRGEFRTASIIYYDHGPKYIVARHRRQSFD